MANVPLNMVKADEKFNFLSVYEENAMIDEGDSPYKNDIYNYDCCYYDPEDFKEKFRDYSNSSALFHINCRSLSANWESFRSLLSELQDETFNFDYIGLSEVFSCEKDARLNLPGYHKLILRTRSDDNLVVYKKFHKLYYS